MTDSIDIDEETISRLEEMRDEVEREIGERITVAELLHRIVEDADESKADLVDSFRDATFPLSDEEIGEFLTETSDSGEPVAEEDIDHVLYFEQQPE